MILLKIILFRLFIGIVIASIVYFTPYFIDQDGKVSMFYYIIVLSSFLLHQVWSSLN